MFLEIDFFKNRQCTRDLRDETNDIYLSPINTHPLCTSALTMTIHVLESVYLTISFVNVILEVVLSRPRNFSGSNRTLFEKPKLYGAQFEYAYSKRRRRDEPRRITH